MRELQNTIERAVILTENGAPVQSASLCLAAGTPAASTRAALEAIDVAFSAKATSRAIAPGGPLEGSVKPLHELEKEHILRALEQTGGNRTKAAELLQISIRTMRNKLNEYRLEGSGVAAP